VGGAVVVLKSNQLYYSQNAPFCGWVCRFNINDPCLLANEWVADIMLWGMAVASIPLAVGIVARSLIEEVLCGCCS
jgi:hypothetical protein